MRWKVVEASTLNGDSVKDSKRIDRNKDSSLSSASYQNNNYKLASKVVVSQINNELGRPSSAPHPLNGKDRAKKRIRRRKIISTVIASPPWKRSVKIDDQAEED